MRKSQEKKVFKSQEKKVVKSQEKNVVRTQEKKVVQSQEKSVIKTQGRKVVNSQEKRVVKTDTKAKGGGNVKYSSCFFSVCNRGINAKSNRRILRIAQYFSFCSCSHSDSYLCGFFVVLI